MTDLCADIRAAADAVLEAGDGMDTFEGRQRMSEALDDLSVALVRHEQTGK